MTKSLFVLGPVAMLAGVWRSSIGLTVVGAVWFVLAFACEQHRTRAQAALDAAKASAEAGGSAKPEISTATFLRGTALFLLAGVPALVIGLTGWQIDEAEWRWLPLVVGAIITALAVISALLFLLGSGISAVVGEPPTVPARIVVVSSKQTGVYVNEMPRLEFVLDVTPQGAATYRVTKRATVPFTALGAIQPGEGFEALVVGPEDPTNMEIDWSSPIPSARAGSPSDRLRELDDLRSQGLITDDEHAAQRQRILDAI